MSLISASQLHPMFMYRGALTASNDLNAVVADGTYVLTARAANMPSAQPTASSLKVENCGNFIVQTIRGLLDPMDGYTRVIRPGIGQFNAWVSLRSRGNLSGKTVVILGDSITEGTGQGEWRSVFAQLTGANVINGGFGGCRMAVHPTATYDTMGFGRLAGFRRANNWSQLITAANTLQRQGDDNRPQANALASLNWNNVDMIIVGFGTNDFAGSVPIGGANATARTTFKGAMRTGIEDFQSSTPNARLVFTTPIFRSRNGGSDVDTNNEGLKLTRYADAILEVCAQYRIPSIDLHRQTGITMANESHWLQDGVHPTRAGYDLLGQLVAAGVPA